MLLKTVEQLLEAQASNPFPEAVDEPKTLHLCFLASDTGAVNWDALNAAKSDSERYKLIESAVFRVA